MKTVSFFAPKRRLCGIRRTALALIVGSLCACASAPPTQPLGTPGPSTAAAPAIGGPAGAPSLSPAGTVLQQANSRWQAVPWSELPGWGTDALHQGWSAWVQSCAVRRNASAALCPEVRQLLLASDAERQAWMERRLQAYRVLDANGQATDGLLTAYYEPILNASRVRTARFRYPLYAPPAGLKAGQAWFSREVIDTDPAAQAALAGREVGWLDDPIDAMLLHIQGSGRLRFEGPTGETVRVAFAGTNNQPYRSINRWLSERGVPTSPWPEATRRWAQANPDQLGPLLWSNPRYVFFRPEPLSALQAELGPKGAQGVPLTPGRSIAVDPNSIPYGTPVWLASQGGGLNTQRLVLAQDTGAAIVGAARADYFMGWGPQALAQAAVVKQPLALWVLWPRE